VSPARDDAELVRAQIAGLRAHLRELEPPPTREQVKEALRAQDGGWTLKEYARIHRLDLRALYRAASERRRWEWRLKERGPSPWDPEP